MSNVQRARAKRKERKKRGAKRLKKGKRKEAGRKKVKKRKRKGKFS